MTVVALVKHLLPADGHGAVDAWRRSERPSSIRLRRFDPDDLSQWLALQRIAWREQVRRPKPWDASWFRREFPCLPYVDSIQVAFAARDVVDGAEAQSITAVTQETAAIEWSMIGSVALKCNARRGGVATMNWLSVHPDWRRQGVASMLTAWAEREAWRRGWQTLRVETLTSWNAALAFYRQRGYSTNSGSTNSGMAPIA